MAEETLYTDSETEIENTSPEPEGEEANENTPTAIVPKEVFAGKILEVGGTVKMRIVAAHEDSFEIQCEHEYGDEGDKSAEQPKAEMPDDMME